MTAIEVLTKTPTRIGFLPTVCPTYGYFVHAIFCSCLSNLTTSGLRDDHELTRVVQDGVANLEHSVVFI